MSDQAAMPQGDDLPVVPGVTITVWPEKRESRRRLTLVADGLGHRGTVVRWAHSKATALGAVGPVLAAWAAVLGVSRATLARWRAEDAEGIGQLPVAPRGDAARFGKV